MVKEIKLPEQSETARKAAEATGSAVAIVLTLNPKRDRWELRVYGSTERARYFAGIFAEHALRSLAKVKPPADADQAFKLLSDEPDAKP